MSDFVRTMRGWTAMCSHFDTCHGCPLCGCGICNKPFHNTTTEDIVLVERAIEIWLKGHPLPSTPTWIKWLSEHGIVDSVEDGNVKLLPLAYYPMDEEIAKQLGELENG